jgi:phosphate transport system substrate-binding protein
MAALSTMAVLLLFLVSDVSCRSFGGATLPEPLYSKWLFGYNLVDPDFFAEYDAVGSSLGFRLVANGSFVFGGSDSLHSSQSLEANGILSIPIVGSTLSVIHHASLLPTPHPLNLTMANVADIFLFRVRFWNDSSLVANNPSLAINANPIAVVARLDGSGTTDIFSRALCAYDVASKNSSLCHRRVSPSDFFRTAMPFPVELRDGNDGVACGVASLRFAIGYSATPYSSAATSSAAVLTNGVFTLPAVDKSAIPPSAVVTLLQPPASPSFQIKINSSEAFYPFIGVTNGLFRLNATPPCDVVERSVSAQKYIPL